MQERTSELRAALEAVRAASRVCRAVQDHLVRTLEKSDKSPVTVADFASQAIVCRALARAFPGDAIVAEEDADELRREDHGALRRAVVEHVEAELGLRVSEVEVLGWIDRGSARAEGARYWTLDPIDGTKGFLRREQYAVALGLVEAGRVVLGVLGCPNLSDSSGACGSLFTATAGGTARAFALPEGGGEGRAIHVDRVRSPEQARLCESVEAGHSDQRESARIAAALGIRSEPLRMDSQCKYAAVARGDASIYLRMPTREEYREKIWDHAAGMLLVEAAGGRVTDIDGRPLDFGRGATLAGNRGVVATSGAIHDSVLDAIRRVREHA